MHPDAGHERANVGSVTRVPKPTPPACFPLPPSPSSPGDSQRSTLAHRGKLFRNTLFAVPHLSQAGRSHNLSRETGHELSASCPKSSPMDGTTNFITRFHQIFSNIFSRHLSESNRGESLRRREKLDCHTWPNGIPHVAIGTAGFP
jgi:hypothetical protein